MLKKFLVSIMFTMLFFSTNVYAATVEDYESLLPDNVLSYIEDIDISVVDSIEGSSDAIGCYNYLDNSIQVLDGYEFAILHEIAHAVDNEDFYASWSSSQYFCKIYAEEMNNNDLYLLSSNSLDDPQEYFAESFSMYFLHNEELKVSNPRTYNYIRGMLFFI